MPAISYEETHGGERRGNERAESAADVMREINEAADTFVCQTGLSHAKAVTKILEARPSLYSRYKAAKIAAGDFRG